MNKQTIHFIGTFLLLNDIGRTAKIGANLEVENHFKCDQKALQTILAMCKLSNMTDEQIQNEFLKMHSVVLKEVEAT